MVASELSFSLGLFSRIHTPYFPLLPVSDCEGACGEVIVRDSVGIWQRGGFGTAPHTDCHSAGLRDSLCRWEVSLIRALIGLTKLITSISEFLKAMRGDAGAREGKFLVGAFADEAESCEHPKQPHPIRL